MTMIKCVLLLLLVILAFLTYSQANIQGVPVRHIVKFKNVAAREEYLSRLPHTSSVELLDKLFVGAIISHDSLDRCLEEEQNLQQLHAMSVNSNYDYDSIEAFERDGYVSISNEELPSFNIFNTMNRKKKQKDAPWHLDRIGRDALPLKGEFEYYDSDKRTEVNVYIVDTGIHAKHKEFQGRAKPAYAANKDFPAGEDCHGHGTHVAALVGGEKSGSYKHAILHDVRVMDCMGSSLNSELIKALEWLIDNASKPAIINLSLGGEASVLIDNAVKSLWKNELFPMIAAGNEGINACSRSPARISEGITVGASTKKDKRAPFSNHGKCVDIFAPGEDIQSAGHLSDDGFAIMSGTSMATPIASGIAASLLTRLGNIKAVDLKKKMLEYSLQSVSDSIKPLANLPANELCPENFGGVDCNVPFCGLKLATDAGVCGGHGKCNGPNKCICDSGYGGPECEEFTCDNVPSHDSKVCSGHGICSAIDTCKCEGGWEGSNCEIEPTPVCYNVSADQEEVCSSHGICSSNDNCTCAEGYFGHDCSQFSCFGRLHDDEHACGGRGKCNSPNQCECNDNAFGFECERIEGDNSRLQAVIEQLNRLIDPNEAITLNGTLSHDPSNAERDQDSINEDEPLLFEWRCEELNGDSGSKNKCAQVHGDESTLTIESETLKELKGGNYRMILYITKGSKREYTSILMQVANDD